MTPIVLMSGLEGWPHTEAEHPSQAFGRTPVGTTTGAKGGLSPADCCDRESVEFRAMSEQTDRHEVTVRCRRCEAGLVRMTPVPPPVRWQVDRIKRVRQHRQSFTLGVSRLGDPRPGLASDDGVLPSPRMLPIPVPSDAYRVALVCRDCRNPTSVKLRTLHARADRAEARGERDVYV
jgi:hypothetical protein